MCSETLFSDADLEQPLPLPRAAPSKPSMEEWLGAKSPEDTALHPLDGRDVLNPEDCKVIECNHSYTVPAEGMHVWNV